MNRTIALALALALVGLAVPHVALAEHHEAVIQSYVVNVVPGKLEEYRAAVRKLSEIMKRVGSTGSVRMWRTTAGGPDTGTILVGIEHANATAWAADSGKMQKDPEWQTVMASLPAIRTIGSNSMWRDISPNASAEGSGGVLLVTGVQVKAGMLEEYRKRVGGLGAISERLGTTGRMRMWVATLAGPNTGNVAVGVEYADLPTYVANQAKSSADPEWAKTIAGLDDIRTIAGRWLYEEITP